MMNKNDIIEDVRNTLAKCIADEIDRGFLDDLRIEDRLEQGWTQLDIDNWPGNAALEWLNTEVGSDDYFYSRGGRLVFKRESDLVWFKLRWL